MISIQIKQYISTSLRSEFDIINSIVVEDKPFAEGGFGEIYNCISINNSKPVISQVIKIFKERYPGSSSNNQITIQRLQAKLKKIQLDLISNGKDIFEEYPAFKGVPQFSFEGIMNGKKVIGFSSNNLTNLGFEEFGKILSEKEKEFNNILLEYKLLLAYQLTSAFRILDEFHYIHADLKPEAIFINLKTFQCAIIDYDSGVITETSEDEPSTWGAPNDWVAPEIWEQQTQKNGDYNIQVDSYTDRWSVLVGIHYFIIGYHPLFFLKELSPIGTNEYFKKNKWPEAETSASYFEQDNNIFYQWYLNYIKNDIPTEIIDNLSISINFGYKNPQARISYKTWEFVFKKAQKPPEIKFFTVDGFDKKAIIKGIYSVLSWEVENVKSIEIDNGIGRVATKGSLKIKPNIDIIYTLKAIGSFGDATAQVDIIVYPTPIMQSLMIPTPDFSNHLHFNIKIEIPHIDVSFKMPNFYQCKPLIEKSVYDKITQVKPIFTKQSIDLIKLRPIELHEKSSFSITKTFERIKSTMSRIKI